MPRRYVLSALCFVLLLVCGCKSREPIGYVVVGSGSDSFTLLAGKLLISALQQEGYQVEDRTGYPSALEARAALTSNAVDLCWFNTSETWHKLLGHDQPIDDPEELANAVAGSDIKQNINWQSPAPYVLRPGLVMRASEAGKLAKISELADYAARHTPLTLCADEEVAGSASKLRLFQVAYQLHIPDERVVPYGPREALQALSAGECNCALSYEVYIADNEEFFFLEDDRNILFSSGYALAARQEVISRYPDIQYILERVDSWLTPANVNALLQKIDAGEPIESVIQQFVQSQSK
ncbi:MAG: hypothetical protein LLG44_00150 [Chloroflexi bacterium]|nr:hypothetical protein [Chloroflexota bacterium]